MAKPTKRRDEWKDHEVYHEELKVSSKFGFTLAPIAQRSKVNDPSGGSTIDAEARTAINAILDTLEAFGFHPSS